MRMLYRSTTTRIFVSLLLRVFFQDPLLCSGFIVVAVTPAVQDKAAAKLGLSATRNNEPGNDDDDDDNATAADDFLSQLAGGINLSLRKEPLQGSKVDLLMQQAGTYDKEVIQGKLQALAADHPVAMLTFNECPYCIESRSILNAKQCSFTELNLDTVGRQSYAYRAELYHMTGRTSVPAIWIGGQFVGGCNDGPLGGGLMNLNASGRLDDLLQQAGAM